MVDIWKFLNARSKGCPLNEYAMSRYVCGYAARNGHLEVLKWAISEGFPRGLIICINAAENGHLEVLKYARSNGCPSESE